MNERIKQLLLQVASRAGEDGEYLPSLHTPEDIERFAELIVRECIKCCIVAEVNYAINGEIEEADGAIGAKELIVGYFGVEE